MFNDLGKFKERILNYKFRKNRSIEHLHPQTSTNSWDPADSLHSFGNLAMISSSFNSSQGNDSVGVKFARMSDNQKEDGLESIKLALMFKESNGLDTQWTQEQAEEHQKQMMEIIKNYYNLESAGSVDIK